jgi:hypothetical protein
MAIALDSNGSATANSATTVSIDITSAATGAFCYCFIQIGTSQTSATTMTGWQQICDINDRTNDHFSLFRRVKQVGDTTFAISWGSASGVAAVWSSYTGLNPSYPDEGLSPATHTVSSTSYTTPNKTPQDNTRWALACAGARSTTTTGETWTAPGTLVNRAQAVNSTLTCSPAVIADSNGAVTAAQHNYTFTLSAAEASGGAIVGFLIPSTATNPAYPLPETRLQAVQTAANW